MRAFNQELLDALSAEQVRIAPLAEFDFASGVERLWAGPEGHVLDYDGKQWTSIGDLGQVDKIAEAHGLQDSRTTVSLRVTSDRVSQITSDDSRGRSATIRLVVLDDKGTPIGDISFKKTMGRLGVRASVQKTDKGRELSEVIELELLDETATLGRSYVTRMTLEDATAIDPNDNFLEFAADPDGANLGPVSDGRRGHVHVNQPGGMGGHGMVRTFLP